MSNQIIPEEVAEIEYTRKQILEKFADFQAQIHNKGDTLDENRRFLVKKVSINSHKIVVTHMILFIDKFHSTVF